MEKIKTNEEKNVNETFVSSLFLLKQYILNDIQVQPRTVTSTFILRGLSTQALKTDNV